LFNRHDPPHDQESIQKSLAAAQAKREEMRITFDVIEKQYELTPREKQLVLEAANRYGKRGPDQSCLAIIEREVSDEKRATDLLRCVSYFKAA